jgi:ATP-grasp domain-containing protein
LNPTVLIVTTSRWFPTARLAVALTNAGCSVQAVCPSDSPIAKTTILKGNFSFRGLAPLKSIAAAIAASKPDLLVSGDDLATWHLHRLYEASDTKDHVGATTRALIARSLGSPEYFPIVDDRASFMRAAQEIGVRVPRTAVIADFQDFQKSEIGFPAVLKANGTSGGDGVRVVRSEQEAQAALRHLQAPPLLARAIKRAIFDKDTTLLRPSLQRRRSTVNAQSFIAGREATSATACWQGTVLAATHFEVLQKGHFAGHATVVRRIDHPEMVSAVEKMARRLQLSGLHGFDFMLEDGSRNAYLIEINPRATQVGHLSFGTGRDLPGALVSALSGRAAQTAPKVKENDVIALFPQEWLRDPLSPYLRSGYHDVPWNQPELLRSAFEKSNRSSSNLFRRFLRKG